MPDTDTEPDLRECIVTARQSITLHGGRPVGPTQVVEIDPTEPTNAEHLEAGRLAFYEPTPDIPKLKIAELRALAENRGVEFEDGATRADLIALLQGPAADPADHADQNSGEDR